LCVQASAGADGLLKFWRLSDRTCVKTLDDVVDRTNGSAPLAIDWHPSGDFIAVPCAAKSVVCVLSRRNAL
jgi:hypothetical protein